MRKIWIRQQYGGEREEYIEKTTEEIQQFLQTLHQESLESHLDAPGLYADAESLGLKYVKPAPGRAALTFAGFTIEEQEQIVEYAEMLIDEAHALCRRLQARCP